MEITRLETLLKTSGRKHFGLLPETIPFTFPESVQLPIEGPQSTCSHTNKTGPRRKTPLPFDNSAFENLTDEDKKWWQDQGTRFSDDSEGLATKPTRDLVVFEAVNFMNGKRTSSEIADLLSAEFLVDIDQAWVERLVGILEKQKLVTK